MHLPIILPTVLALGLIEAASWWWMHPAPAGQADPVLTYQHGIVDRGSKIADEENAPAHSSLPNPSSFTALPELVSRSIPSLRCSTGTAARIDRDDGVVVHVAFFQWDLAASDNVLEAFKHLPEECMGANGMNLVKTHPPRSYVVGGQGAGDASRSKSLKVESRKSDSMTPQRLSSSSSSSDLRLSDLKTFDSSSSSSISFDHTEFRDPAGRPIHAFKGVWVTGGKDLLGDEARGGGEQWRQIRWKSALKRFRPAHARVAQGAVHGIAHPDRAWEIFEESMLKDLKFE